MSAGLKFGGAIVCYLRMRQRRREEGRRDGMNEWT